MDLSAEHVIKSIEMLPTPVFYLLSTKTACAVVTLE